jgi:hypothetical protein
MVEVNIAYKIFILKISSKDTTSEAHAQMEG